MAVTVFSRTQRHECFAVLHPQFIGFAFPAPYFNSDLSHTSLCAA